MHSAVPDAVLIGGWATWVRTGGPMSHDIDLIVTRPQLELIKEMTDDFSKSRHLGGRKWRATLDDIHIDLYVPFDSRLGQHLQLRTEVLVRKQEIVDGWVLLDLPGHIATKFAALIDRPESNPGEKDRLEILDLLAQGVDSAEAVQALHAASTLSSQEVTQLIVKAFSYLGDLQIGRDQRKHLNELGVQWQEQSIKRQLHDLSKVGTVPPEHDRQRRGPGLGL